jgi:hypothetical protein
MGQLLEGITEFRADLSELKELTQQQGAHRRTHCSDLERQAETTARFVGIVE